MDFLVCERIVEVLRIGIHHDEFNATNFGVDHVVDGVLSGTSNSDDFDAGECLDFRIDFGHRIIGLKASNEPASFYQILEKRKWVHNAHISY